MRRTLFALALPTAPGRSDRCEGIGEADLAACQQDIVRAKRICIAAQEQAANLPALAWLFNYKEALYALCELQWAEVREGN